MKKYSSNRLWILFGLILFILCCCVPTKEQPELATNPATLTTKDPNVLTSSVAILGGEVTSDGNNPVTERGIVYATTQNPTTANTKLPNGSGVGPFSSSVTGLTAKTTYFARAYAINSQGTFYGNQVSFITPAAVIALTVTDADGNVYKTATIGTQVWMAENLKTTKYNDNTAIPNVSDPVAWGALTTGAYCWYNNDTGNKNTFGALYNFYVNNNGKLCPTGWHVPTYAEWTTMVNFLGGVDLAAGKLKTTSGWDNNGNGSNSSEFSAPPGGSRLSDNSYAGIGYSAYFWPSYDSGLQSTSAYTLSVSNYLVLSSNFSKKIGMSVRCLKD
jgi:uncharacterized protein (TIGR02145 family)